MTDFLKKNKYQVLLWLGITAYSIYFSWFTIQRVLALYASYYDLGIMHHTVYNTFMSLKTGDWGRFLEMTNTVGPNQIKRMAIHNDLLLALLAPFYFIYESPFTILVIQSVVVALGAWPVFKISQNIFTKHKLKNQLSLFFAYSYLLFPVLQLANIYEFHSVTLATSLLLYMFYFWMEKKYSWSYLFFALALLTKEQIGLTTIFFGFYVLFTQKKEKRFAYTIMIISALHFIVSNFMIIPYFRSGDEHFALNYYDHVKQNPLGAAWAVVTGSKTYGYLLHLLGPLGFVSLLSPFSLLVAGPELAINLLSKSRNMTYIIYHYTAVITPFVFISAIYGAKKLIKRIGEKDTLLYLMTFTFFFAVLVGPLPFSKRKNIHPYAYPQKEKPHILEWSKKIERRQD